jgi:hypothetical protein
MEEEPPTFVDSQVVTEISVSLFRGELDSGPCDALLPGEEGEVRHIWQSLFCKQALPKHFI